MLRGGNITLALDSSEALNQAKGGFPLQSGQESFDLIHAIRKSASHLLFVVQWHWIKGHQNEGNAIQNQDWWSQQNAVCNAMAKNYWNTYQNLRISHESCLL